MKEFTTTIQLPVSQETARVLAANPARAAGVAALVNQIISHSRRDRADRLARLIEQSSSSARAAGLTDEDVDAEMASYKAERGTRRM
ncbi:hypothetical protein HN018_26005 (plasmid) [Lichenicola cladoniae]|uniref:Uncharacterized protein n=1 Tax=Lichenicola cladoniae TaxID=1484109 RepID=A0A6M8HZ43_9PROT|nr:hypothetical protein [Lichenicola cladoniae]NPD70073.1 hypothetical protein [Acetobacteraceae bacterium]QKE93618.1 hypothetical protein HN018_26005 [Lichenicola cladoniae]